MKTRLAFLAYVGVILMTSCFGARPTLAARIEAKAGKKYVLTKQHGPWNIMVATFHTTGADGQSDQGKSPEEAADELVLELRRRGLPAYTYTYEPEAERIVTTDRLGREERRKNLRRYRSVCVIAGNYNDINDEVAQQTLKWVKQLYPDCLKEGVVYQPTPGQPTPLSGAFLTINPLLSPEEVEQRRQDPLLIRLNSGERFSLYENGGQYTLVVARFYGKHVNVKAGGVVPDIKSFLKDNDLDDAATAARELVACLRGKYDQSGKFNNIEAYVWHDRYESVVTVGAFSSPNDPAIKRYLELFGPRSVPVAAGSAQVNVQPAHFGLQGFGDKGDQTRLWVFEPDPQLMRVPKGKS